MPVSNPDMPENFIQDVHDALKILGTRGTNVPLAYLVAVQLAQQEQQISLRQASDQLILRALDLMSTDVEESASLLRLRFVDRKLVRTIADERHQSEMTVFRAQSRAIKDMSRYLVRFEINARKVRADIQTQRLGSVGYTKLVGVDSDIETLLDVLTKPEPPWLVSLEGLGGIGKTSLADAIARRVINDESFVDLVWLSARQQFFSLGGVVREAGEPAFTDEALIDGMIEQLLPGISDETTFAEKVIELQRLCRQESYLIVVDNLETVSEVEGLLPTIHKLTNPAKFLMTSRHSLRPDPDVFSFRVKELGETDAIRLVRREADFRNIPEIAGASDTDLHAIYRAVGGNPLAIRLVVGQAHVHGLRAFLEDLKSAQGRTAENLYSFIFRWAWDNLDDLARRTLLAMPLLPINGGSADNLAQITGFQMHILREALDRLVNMNLVDSHGDLNDRYYTIHNLTRSFLHKQVVRWE